MAKVVEVKMPWIKFFPSDWKSDNRLSRCSPATRGIWIDLICDMHDSSRSGKISGSLMELSRAARCTTAEIQVAIEELSSTKTADVTLHHDFVTVVNRRMNRDYKKREMSRLRQIKHRSHAPVTKKYTTEVRSQMSYTPLSPTESHNGNGGLPIKSLWLILWETYPANRRGDPEAKGENSGFHEFSKLKPDKALFARMLASIDALKQTEDWKKDNGKYIKNIVKFLKERIWETVQVIIPCETCSQIGVIVRNNGNVMPWSLEREAQEGAKFEVCPDCKGKDRVNTPGLPPIKFPTGR
jgi:hypothetical protein